METPVIRAMLVRCCRLQPGVPPDRLPLLFLWFGPAGAVKRVLPICLEVTTPCLHYVRVHRRHGTTDR